MGKFSEQLMQKYRAKRTAERVKSKWPKGFDGVIMYCSLCSKEIRRIPKGQPISQAEQRQAVDKHSQVCVRAKMGVVE